MPDRPRPEQVQTLDELIVALRVLKVWAGNPSLRQIEKLSGLARSTLADALSPKRRTAPAVEVFQALLGAFGVEDAHEWLDAWRRVQAEPARAPVVHAVVPRQLPAVVPGFTGRAKALKELSALLEDGSRLAVVCGIPGVGKTALTVQWAHQVANRFPDGQVYLDLRGYSSGPPVTPDQALALAIRAFGVPGEDIPLQQDAMVGMYRSITSEKRALVVVDNAPSAAHVRPLVPGGSGCMTVVTSRDRMAGLVAREGAHRLELGVLTPEEAPAVVISVLGPERVLREEDAVEDLIRLCGYLPLALRITAANLADRPHQTIEEHVAELVGGDRLGAFEIEGDTDAAVRTAFGHSYVALDPLARTLFRRMGFAPGPELSASTAAVLLDRSEAETAPVLRALVGAHLVEARAAGRYGLHDLLRLYGRDRYASEETDDAAAAVERFYAHYLDMAVAAARSVRPDFLVLSDVVPQQAFTKAADALQWFDAERATVVTAVEKAAELGQARMAWLLTDALRGCYWLRRHTAEWLAVARVGLAAAEQADDAQAAAAMQLSLGTAHWSAGDLRVAAEHFQQAVAASRAAGDRYREFSTLGNLGGIYSELGALSDTADCYTRELAFYAEIGDSARRARALGNLGLIQLRLGTLVESAASLRAAVELRESIGETRSAANSLGALGIVHRYLGDLDQAAEHLRRARQLNHDHEDRLGEAAALDDLARVHRDAGRPAEALHCAEQALTLASGRVEIDARITVAAVRGRRDDLLRASRQAAGVGYGHGMADALVELSWLELAAGDRAAAAAAAVEARDHAAATGLRILEGLALTAQCAAEGSVEAGQAAVEVLEGTGYRLGIARALLHLGVVSDDGSDTWQRALDIFEAVGSEEAARVRSLLSVRNRPNSL